MRRFLTIAAFILFLSGVTSLRAHHGWSEFDQEKRIELEGTVIESSFEYPHASIQLLVGEEEWEVIMAPPARVRRVGLDEDVLANGAEISITGHPHRTKANLTRIFELTVGEETYTVR
jgi:hypothetical protein